MLKKLIVMVFLSVSSYAELDYFLAGSFRSYPIGTAITAEIGKGFKFYEKNKILYGYLRPAINVQSSALINQASAQIDFYPVSFLGFYAGRGIGAKSTKKLQGFDCDVIKCDGGVSKTYFGVNLALAYKKLKFVSYLRRTQVDLNNHQGYFAEEFSNLIGLDKDRLTSYTGILGYDLDAKNFLALLYLSNKMQNTDQSSKMKMLLYQYRPDKVSYQAALGTFENRVASEHLALLLMFKWEFEKGVRLF